MFAVVSVYWLFAAVNCDGGVPVAWGLALAYILGWLMGLVGKEPKLTICGSM